MSRARISMMCGDFDTALALLDRSLQTPAGITVQELRLHPIWDLLRSDCAFSANAGEVWQQVVGRSNKPATSAEESCLI